MERTPLKHSIVPYEELDRYTVKSNGTISDLNEKNGRLCYQALPADLKDGTLQLSETKKSVPEDKESLKLSFSMLSSGNIYVLVLCCSAQLFSALAFAIIAPFYPYEAKKKGVTSTQIGMVFSIFELVNVVMSPIIGNYLTRIGTRFVFISGVFLAGATTILFGILDHCPYGTSFFVMSLLVRALTALGFCAFSVANFAIIASEFPSGAATVFGVLETMQGVGMLSGPLFGSFLYELGGFGAPFYSLGALLLVCDVLIFSLLPENAEPKQDYSISVLTVSKFPLVIVSVFNITTVSLGLGFMDSMMSQRLQDKFGLNVAVIGLVYAISPAIYGLSMPVWGFLVDRANIKYPLVTIGLLGCMLGFLVMAPCPWPAILPVELWTMLVGSFVIGVSTGPAFIGSTKCLITAILENGYIDNFETFSIVSGLFCFSLSLGAFVGPLIGGFLTDHLGFPVSCSIIGLIHAPNLIVSAGYFLHRHRTEKDELGSDHRTDKLGC